MADSSSVADYYVWALKMKVVLRAEGQWGITEEVQTNTVYPITIDGEAYTEAQLKKKKALA